MEFEMINCTRVDALGIYIYRDSVHNVVASDAVEVRIGSEQCMISPAWSDLQSAVNTFSGMADFSISLKDRRCPVMITFGQNYEEKTCSVEETDIR